MSFLDIIAAVAPTIASCLGGPLAGAAVGFIAKHIGLPATATQADVQQAMSGMTGEQVASLKLAEIEFKQHLADNNIAIDMGNIGTNTAEASSESIFVAGWRPFVGWVCGLGLGYVAIFEPLIRFVATVGFHYVGSYPIIDTTLTMQVLLGLLGMGAMRSYDKKNGNGNGH